MGRRSDKNAHLLVEGKNDQHVIWALCEQYHIPETFDVIVPGAGGLEAVLADLPARIDESDLRALGIVLDADENIQAPCNRLYIRFQEIGYDMPTQPVAEGFITLPPDRPPIGVWLMPDNQLPGMLEDFVSALIPPKDRLKPIADKTLQAIEKKGLNRYKLSHRPKALIHTWLAWQENPGMPLGQAITAQGLQHNQALAQCFVAWLQRLFSQ
jgi:hypothetical protein